jgi:hypothetical protein
MAGARITPRSGHALSLNELKKEMGKDSSLFTFLEHYALADRHFDRFDFGVKALDTTNQWTVGAGATATTWAVASPDATAPTIIRGVAGTTAATSGLQIVTPAKFFYGDNDCGMQIRFRDSVITEGRLEIGFFDAKPAANTNLGNNLTTPTFNTAVDVAAFLYDHTGSTTTQGLYTKGNNGQTAAKQAITSGLAADTWMTVRIQIIADDVYLFVDGKLMASKASGIEGGDGLILGLLSKSSDTTDRNIDIDYIAYWANRA